LLPTADATLLPGSNAVLTLLYLQALLLPDETLLHKQRVFQ